MDTPSFKPAAKSLTGANCKNIVLIGMSGAGKSTLGVLLAKSLGLQFVDTDLVLQQKNGRLLQQILDTDGVERFLQLEEEAVSSLDLHGCVVATGGSVVYSKRAMAHLGKNAKIVYLRVGFETLNRRLSNITTRGIVFKGTNDLRAVYEERLTLYERYADLCVDCSDGDVEDSLKQILSALQG